MCGIAGCIDFRGRPIDHELLQHACRRLAHRGPDDRGVWLSEGGDPRVGLAHTRLAVIDPGPAGRQPMCDAAGRRVIVFNGEIYNYRELHEDLAHRGHHFRTQSDTEVLLCGYAEWGDGLFERLNGMWALCLFDADRGRGVLVRDRFGIKPLLYAAEPDRLVFGSEMSALALLADSAELCAEGLGHYLRFGYIAQPRTIYRDCRRLPPGHLLHFDARGSRAPQRYYRPTIDPDLSRLSYPEACRAVRDRLRRSVRAREVADVPIGAFLSGGLDSSIVVRHLAEDRGAGVRTFSVGFADQPQYDESRYARQVAEYLGTEHHPLALTGQEVLDQLPSVLDGLSEPFADASLIPTVLLSRHARGTVTVALSGDGADELFGGYRRYLGHRYLEAFLRLPRGIRQRLCEPLLRALPVSKSNSIEDLLRQIRKLLRTAGTAPLQRHWAWSRITDAETERLLDPHGLLPPPDAELDRVAAGVDRGLLEAWSDDPLNQILMTDLQYQLPADMLTKVDLASMACGLEVRVPMLDPAVVSLAVSLPSEFKIAGAHRKRLLVDAYRGALPPQVLKRRKMGFELPVGEFLRAQWRDVFLSTVSRKVVQELPPLDFDGVMGLYRDHCDRRIECADTLYAVLVLCWWVTGRRRSPGPQGGLRPP